jgi:hypothetical protein
MISRGTIDREHVLAVTYYVMRISGGKEPRLFWRWQQYRIQVLKRRGEPRAAGSASSVSSVSSYCSFNKTGAKGRTIAGPCCNRAEGRSTARLGRAGDSSALHQRVPQKSSNEMLQSTPKHRRQSKFTFMALCYCSWLLSRRMDQLRCY